MGRPLLLHSLTFYSALLRELAALPSNPDVVEIGSQEGEVSVLLAEAAETRGGQLHVVEPYPSSILRELSARRSNVNIVESTSPQALTGLETAGMYVLDGDHNYSVVHRELEEIFRRSDSADSVVVMHDVGWPWARRDMYYAPDALPKDAVHEFSYRRGVTLDQTELDKPDRGFRSLGAYALALREGGPRNGVLTAVEDVLAEHPERKLLVTPLVFGLGVIGCSSSAVWPEVCRVMQPYTDNPTLQEMEANRLTLFLEVLRLRDSGWRARADRLKRRLLDAGARVSTTAGG